MVEQPRHYYLFVPVIIHNSTCKPSRTNLSGDTIVRVGLHILLCMMKAKHEKKTTKIESSQSIKLTSFANTNKQSHLIIYQNQQNKT